VADIEHLARQSCSEHVRLAAEDALEQMACAEALQVEALRALLLHDGDAAIRWAAHRALARARALG